MNYLLPIILLTLFLNAKAIDIVTSKYPTLENSIDNSSSYSIIYRFGTLGLGVDFEYMFNSTLGARVNLNGFSYRVSGVALGDNKYSFKGNLKSSGLIIDYHPWQNAIRLSGGLYNHKSAITGVIKPTSGDIVLGDRVYPSMQIGSIDTKIDFNKVNPYMGIGFSSASKDGWHFVADIGALFIGTPKAKLTAKAAKGFEGLQGVLNNEAKIEEANINKDIQKYHWYPVLSVGMQFKY
jgi:hypothetical protein